MELRPMQRRPVTDQLVDQLLRAILDGDAPPGSRLPTERELSEQSGINRQAVREALQRLKQMGVVDVVHGDGIRVLDWRTNAGLPLLPRLMIGHDGAVDPDTARSFLEFRSTIGSEGARLCARRAGPEVHEQLGKLGERIASGAGEARLWGAAAYELWDLVLAASGNVAYQLASNTLTATIDEISPQLAEILEVTWAKELGFRVLGEAILPNAPELEASLCAGYRELIAALVAGDEAAAASIGRRVLDDGASAVLAFAGVPS